MHHSSSVTIEPAAADEPGRVPPPRTLRRPAALAASESYSLTVSRCQGGHSSQVPWMYPVRPLPRRACRCPCRTG